MMITPSDKIDLLGGTTKAAKLLGVPVTTVHAWKVKGVIPEWRIQAVDDAIAALPPADAPAPSEEAAA